jgi:hypothetical protein
LCCFCVCYVLKRKRTSHGHVSGGEATGVIGGQSVHVVGQQGGSAYPSQPAAYPSYPTSQPAYPAQQPAYPAYPTQSAGYQTQPAPYPSYPMTNVGGGSDIPPPYPTGDKQPAFNPNYPQ